VTDLEAADVLVILMERIGDDELTELARMASRKAARLARSQDTLDRAWAPILSVIATAAEAALLRRRTGVTV
jgi:hypothetical protein